jgi:hypothetical protein
MTRTDFRLTFKLHRFELVAVLTGAVLLVAAALYTASLFDGVGARPECFAEYYEAQSTGEPAPDDEPPSRRACRELVERFNDIEYGLASLVSAAATIFPVLAGIVVGAPAVARELERGTLPLAWTLGGSRRRWLAIRLAVLMTFMVLAFVPLGLAMDRLEASRLPSLDPGQSFQHEGMRGWLLAARGIAAFAVTTLVGLILGRQVPAIIVGVVATAAVVLGGYLAVDQWARAVATPQVREVSSPGDRFVDSLLRSRADGSYVSFEEAYAMQPEDGDPDGLWFDEHFEYVVVAVPGARYPEAVMIGSGTLLGGAVLSSLLGLWLVERRRAT